MVLTSLCIFHVFTLNLLNPLTSANTLNCYFPLHTVFCTEKYPISSSSSILWMVISQTVDILSPFHEVLKETIIFICVTLNFLS
jgi:hypothetical protein